jgi:hypothetical protein
MVKYDDTKADSHDNSTEIEELTETEAKLEFLKEFVSRHGDTCAEIVKVLTVVVVVTQEFYRIRWRDAL